MYKFNLADKISVILVIIGALNWGLFGLFNLDLVKYIYDLLSPQDTSQVLQRITYILVGVAGLNILLLIYKSKFAHLSK
jgi:Uncharacterized conserved protein